MIAVALGVIAAVSLLIGGVVSGSDTPDTLSFFGIAVRTTSAQIFLTGALCTWALLAAAWLLTAGLRRSRERGEELALRRRSCRLRGLSGAELLGFSSEDPAGASSPGGTGTGPIVTDMSGVDAAVLDRRDRRSVLDRVVLDGAVVDRTGAGDRRHEIRVRQDPPE